MRKIIAKVIRTGTQMRSRVLWSYWHVINLVEVLLLYRHYIDCIASCSASGDVCEDQVSMLSLLALSVGFCTTELLTHLWHRLRGSFLNASIPSFLSDPSEQY